MVTLICFGRSKIIVCNYVEEPKLPRKRKVPTRYEEGAAEPEFLDDCKQYFRINYFEAVDLIISSINERFDQPGYTTYKNLQDLLLKAVRKEFEDCFSTVTSLYGSDLNPTQLKLHLDILAANFPPESRSATIFDVKDYILTLSPLERQLIYIVLKLILAMPSTNAISERSFSALRRVKTYLRSTMTQERLNNLLMLLVHTDYTDTLDLVATANEFVRDSEYRLSTFRKFTSLDALSVVSNVSPC